MLAILIMLTPGHQNKFIDCQKTHVGITVLSIIDVKAQWNSTLELLERAYQLTEVTNKSLNNANYGDYQAFCTNPFECTIVMYVIEVLRPFRYRTHWM